MVQDVAQLQSHAVFPEVAIKVAAAFLDKFIPVEKEGAKIILGKLFIVRMLAENLFDRLLLFAREEKRQALFNRVHVESVDQLTTKVGVIEIAFAEAP